jgi:hypothetical protein
MIKNEKYLILLLEKKYGRRSYRKHVIDIDAGMFNVS